MPKGTLRFNHGLTFRSLFAFAELRIIAFKGSGRLLKQHAVKFLKKKFLAEVKSKLRGAICESIPSCDV